MNKEMTATDIYNIILEDLIKTKLDAKFLNTVRKMASDVFSFYKNNPDEVGFNYERGYCDYITPSHKRCFVGRFLLNKQQAYKVKKDGLTINDFINDNPSKQVRGYLLSDWPPLFLIWMQHWHDSFALKISGFTPEYVPDYIETAIVSALDDYERKMDK